MITTRESCSMSSDIKQANKQVSKEHASKQASVRKGARNYKYKASKQTNTLYTIIHS